MERKTRLAGLDLVKVLAVLFVISIHTIGNLHVLAMDMRGVRAFVIVAFRYFVMSCVPLFLIITGFLQGRKTANRGFYSGLIPVVASYLFIAALGAIYNMSQDSALTWGTAVLSILNFTANNYAWYVEMFIGLFLLIPFLNKGYTSLEQKKPKLWLLAIMVLLSIAPSITTVFKNTVHDFDVIPNYWMELYPFTYYLIGVFIAEYRPKFNRVLCAALALLSAVIPTTLVFLKSGGGPYVDWVLNGFFSLSSMLVALGVFLTLYDLDIQAKPIRFVLSTVAVSSLDIYLFSNLAEKIIYPMVGEFSFKLPVMILLIFAASFAAAKVKQLIFFLVKWSWRMLRGGKTQAS